MITRLILSIITFIGGILWLIMAYGNVKSQDGYLTFFTTCDYTDGTCKTSKPRNIFLSRALRAINCPVLGWKDWGPNKVTAGCKTQTKGKATWISTIVTIGISIISSIIIYYILKQKDVISNKSLIFNIVLLLLILSGIIGILNVPFGNGPFNETHSSHTIHLCFAILIFTSMTILMISMAMQLFRSGHRSASTKLTILIIVMIIVLVSTLIVENTVDNGKKGQKLYDFYQKTQFNRNLLDLIFQLGENLPLILFFSSIVIMANIQIKQSNLS